MILCFDFLTLSIVDPLPNDLHEFQIRNCNRVLDCGARWGTGCMIKTVDPIVDPRATIGMADPCEVDSVWATIHLPEISNRV